MVQLHDRLAASRDATINSSKPAGSMKRDPQRVDVGQPFADGAAARVEPQQQPLGVEAEVQTLDQLAFGPCSSCRATAVAA